MIVVSTGCPAGIGPEISVAAASAQPKGCVLVGELATLRAAAECIGVPPDRLQLLGSAQSRDIAVLEAGPKLSAADRRPARPTRRSGAAQLSYIDFAYDLVKATPGAALVTAPVSKSVIARSGAPGAQRFLGHTEWLQRRDGASRSTMCFASSRLATALVTTHLPLSRVPRTLNAERVADTTIALAELLLQLKRRKLHLAVCSLNPHAGESELLGSEEARAIVPGIEAARLRLPRSVRISGPIGAETAFRKAWAGLYQGVVAMYHDQATIPMKLVAFGRAVNITWGLSVVRTSVDHGTGYDIAWKGEADARGLHSAMRMARRLVGAK